MEQGGGGTGGQDKSGGRNSKGMGGSAKEELTKPQNQLCHATIKSGFNYCNTQRRKTSARDGMGAREEKRAKTLAQIKKN